MHIQSIATAFVGIAIAMLVGCAPTPPRATYDYSETYYQQRAMYDCPSRCGVIRDVGQVYVRDNSTTGNGAALGAVIGAVFGNAIGRGNGRTAATVAGAVAGGFAGNAIESSSNQDGRPAWQFHVKLDDGRWATVTQWNNGNLRPGDRVIVHNNRLYRY
ncbi:MAG: glycine zipper 2TM domain-containing protein [Rhodanobacter sp.]|jgi:outer membrane lipoprotein SlyB|nr:glycine zipper 2TM domain-containing protein [Rhodanobacter sp.]